MAARPEEVEEELSPVAVEQHTSQDKRAPLPHLQAQVSEEEGS